MNLAICAIVRDERNSYIKEWIDWHRKIGVCKFIIYNNGADDFVKGDDVVEISWQGQEMQLSAYQHCLDNYKEFEFIAFIDLDEFIIENGHLESLLKNCHNGLALNWKVFGSSGLDYNHSGKQMGVFTKHVNHSAYSTIKSIVRVKNTVSVASPHHFYFIDGRGIDTVDHKIVGGPLNELKFFPSVAINHYMVRSRADWAYKSFKGRVDVKDCKYDLSILDKVDSICTESDNTQYGN